EILGRTHPTLLDLGVALFAGAVGAYCQCDNKLSDSLAGVAISVALVPPLSVVGIGLASGSESVWAGAALLYITNLIGITVAGSLVFLLRGFIPLRKAGKGLVISAIASIVLIVPLALSMRELVLENQISTTIGRLLREKTFTFKNVQLSEVTVDGFKQPMTVVATILAPEQPINSHQVALVRDFLVRELNTPMDFRLRIIPTREIDASEVAAEEQKTPAGAESDSSAPASSGSTSSAPSETSTSPAETVKENTVEEKLPADSLPTQGQSTDKAPADSEP
ncbi:MAG TPA: DUF389 domain-containing protein, partial [Chroococcales cyanobacterium]